MPLITIFEYQPVPTPSSFRERPTQYPAQLGLSWISSVTLQLKSRIYENVEDMQEMLSGPMVRLVRISSEAFLLGIAPGLNY
jgi:hypothetical protein